MNNLEKNFEFYYKNWKDFYKKFFDETGQKNFKEFSKKCLKNEKSLRSLNYGKRFIGLADCIKNLDEGSGSWQIFFLVVCIESIYRIQNDKINERNISEKSFKSFCEENFLPVDKNNIKKSFFIKDGHKNKQLTFEQVITYFYKIRCDVVHKGLYNSFHWNESDYLNSFFVEYKEKGKVKKDTLKIKEMSYLKIRPMFIKAIIQSLK